MLSIVSTPIGNLSDITLRAIETLKKCDAIICEDTRVTGNLLKLLNLPKKELISFHGYSEKGKLEYILNRLAKGEHLSLVTDSGTPGISDPGYAIVSALHAAGRGVLQYAPTRNSAPIAIEVVPGPSAFLAALSASGLPINQFLYLGFLPMKKGRKTLMESFKNEEHTIVFYESVHRIERTLLELADTLKNQPERLVVIARELTKIHEEVVTTTVRELPSVAECIMKKGEFVIMIGVKNAPSTK